MNSKISIIILNWNGVDDTIECIESLKLIDYNNFDVVVVDNHSSGNDVDLIQDRFGSYISKIIVNEENLGFTGGNNLGIKYALENNAEYILLLNNDTVVEKDFLTELLKGFEMDSDVAVTAPVIKYYEKKNIIWSAGGFVDKFRGSGYSYFKDKPDKLLTSDRYCSFVSGCCMLIKNDVFKKIGYFDDEYFLYLEDVDFSYRIVKSNLKNLLIKNSVIYHKVNASSKGKYNAVPLYYNIRNRLLFSRKHLGTNFYIVLAYMIVVFSFKVLLLFNNISFRKIVRKAFSDFSNGKFGKIDPRELNL